MLKGDIRVSSWKSSLTRRPVMLSGAAAVAAALARVPLASSHAAPVSAANRTGAQAVRPDVAPPVLTFKMNGKKVVIGGTQKSGAVKVVFTVTGEASGDPTRWQNNGFLVHMIFGAEASSLASADKIAADLKAGNDNAALALAINSYSWDNVLSHGQSFETRVSQPAGCWVIACFMDTQDGREHTTFGMEKVIEIVK